MTRWSNEGHRRWWHEPALDLDRGVLWEASGTMVLIDLMNGPYVTLCRLTTIASYAVTQVES